MKNALHSVFINEYRLFMISCLQVGDGLIQYERCIIDMKKVEEESAANGGVFVWCGGQVMTLISLL